MSALRRVRTACRGDGKGEYVKVTLMEFSSDSLANDHILPVPEKMGSNTVKP